jgi:hypothetical protein
MTGLAVKTTPNLVLKLAAGRKDGLVVRQAEYHVPRTGRPTMPITGPLTEIGGRCLMSRVVPVGGIATLDGLQRHHRRVFSSCKRPARDQHCVSGED